MNNAAPSPLSPMPQPLFGWRRVRVVLIVSLLVSIPWMAIWTAWWITLVARLVLIGLAQVMVFGLFERWPQRLPSWLARWALQVAAVAIVVPFAVALAYTLTTVTDIAPWYQKKLDGFFGMSVVATLISPWIAMSALYRHISGQAQRQALSFELERSEFARDSLDSRLRLLQAQVEPHFLFNTLANVRELVDSGSSQASQVLNSLIAYLRAAVPSLNDAASTLGQELDLVRAYLELMHMRMPDRLQFTIDVDDAALRIKCPPMTLLTLVENAVRHGIDPSEEGGQIDVTVRIEGDRCFALVVDTGVGLGQGNQGSQGSQGSHGLGTGLSNLRERLQLIFSGDAQLNLAALSPHGFSAELTFPATLNSPTRSTP